MFKRLQHYGGRVVRRRQTRDSRLDAVPLERATAAGELWVGNLGTVVRFLAEPVPPLVTPITDPTGKRKLTAETLERVANLGERWSGELRDCAARMRDGDDDEYKKGPHNKGLPNADSRTRRGTFDALRRMNDVTRSAISRVQRANQAARDNGLWTGKSGGRDAPLPAIAGVSAQERVAAINAANRAFWKSR
jgi:hypothetical protein